MLGQKCLSLTRKAMSDYKFTLPYPPSINGYWRNFKGRQIISKRGREYVKLVAEKMLELKLHSEMISANVNFEMTINPPTLRKSPAPDDFMISRSRFKDPTNSVCLTDARQLGKLLVRLLAGLTLCIAGGCVSRHSRVSCLFPFFPFPLSWSITLRS